MQEFRPDGVGDWEPLDYEKMRARMESDEVIGYNIRKGVAETLSVLRASREVKKQKARAKKKAAKASRRRNRR